MWVNSNNICSGFESNKHMLFLTLKFLFRWFGYFQSITSVLTDLIIHCSYLLYLIGNLNLHIVICFSCIRLWWNNLNYVLIIDLTIIVKLHRVYTIGITNLDVVTLNRWIWFDSIVIHLLLSMVSKCIRRMLIWYLQKY